MELERSENNKLTIRYKSEDAFSKMFLGALSGVNSGVKKVYYELYDKSGKLVSIIEDKYIAHMAAIRNDLDYREVIFEEIFEPTEVEE